MSVAGTWKRTETKVKASTAATYLVGVVALAIITAVQNHMELLGGLPDWAQVLVAPLIPAAAAAVAGWSAKHTPRPTAPAPPSTPPAAPPAPPQQ